MEHTAAKESEARKHEHARHHKPKTKIDAGTIILSLIVLLAVVVLINAIMLISVNMRFAATKEQARPANIQIITLKDITCADCADLSSVITTIEKAPVKVTQQSTVDVNTADGKALIAKYGITKVPTLIITGELNKSGLLGTWSQIGVVSGDALVLTKINPPYIDLATNTEKGLVTLTELEDMSCTQCSSLSALVAQIKQVVKIVNETTVDVSDAAGKQLVSSYGITKVPTIILSKEINDYDSLQQALSQLGTKEADGSFVFTNINPPYMDLQKNAVRGIVSLIMLNDSRCSSCYDVTLHKKVLAQYGVTPVNETVVDVFTPEGQALVAKYNITNVPTVIVTGDVSAYTALTQVWTKVGAIEADGSYVFTNMGALQGANYFDLATNKTA